MSGHQEKNADFFLKLPLKDLQSLCKRHDLPTNKTRVKLANSLASFFKKKNDYTSSLEDRSSSPVKASDTIPLSVSQSKETAHLPEEGRRGIKVAGADSSHCQAGIQPYNSAEGVVVPCLPHSRAGEGFCCATYEPVIGALKRLVTADVQGNTRNTEVSVGCHGAVTRNVTCDPSPSKIVGQEMSDNVTADRGPKQVVTECSMGSKLLSSDEITTKALSSFEFSVYAEEGINLNVDLNSNMSEYINDMIIRQKAQYQNPWALSNHVRGLADTGKHTEVPSSGVSVGLQNGVERKCINSSLSSAGSKSCHSERCVPDRTAVISGSPVLTKNDTPIKIVGCSDENQMISTSSITCLNAQESQLASDVVSHPGKSEVLPQNSVDTYRMETANSSVSDARLKPIPAVDVLNPDGTKNYDPMDGLVTTSIDSDNVEASSLCNIAVSLSDEQGVNIRDRRILKTSHIHNSDSTLCQVPMEKGATLGTSENHLPSRQIQHVCGDLENSVAKESISAVNTDLGCIVAKETGSSKCLEYQSSPVRHPKRSYHSEFPSKSQHANSKNKRTMSLRSAKTSERETFPRRSTRHIK